MLGELVQGHNKRFSWFTCLLTPHIKFGAFEDNVPFYDDIIVKFVENDIGLFGIVICQVEAPEDIL